MKTYLSSRLFFIGLWLRIILILLAKPVIQSQWFIPFLKQGLLSFSLDPWTSAYTNHLSDASFPYGPIMYLAYAPAIAIGALLEWFGLSFTTAAHLGMHFCTFIFDTTLLLVLALMVKHKHQRLLMQLYWLSPVVILINYWHGQLDIVPVLLLTLSFYFMQQQRPLWSCVLLGLGISAKLHVLLAVPFFYIYLLRNQNLTKHLPIMSLIIAMVVGVFLLPCLWSTGFLMMVLKTKEMQKVYLLSIALNEHVRIYMLPLVYMLIAYQAYQIERMRFMLFFILCGIGFFSVLMLTPAAFGWYLWVIPFLVVFHMHNQEHRRLWFLGFSYVYAICALLFAEGAYLLLTPYLQVLWPQELSHIVQHINNIKQHYILQSYLTTALCTCGIILCINMYTLGIKRNDFFKLSRKPLVIGVSGDSGSGKDTFSQACARIFGDQCVTQICGDDYHKWDRKAAFWKGLTHLNPSANNIRKLAQDVHQLLAKKNIYARHYDHHHGVFTRAQAIFHNDVLIVNGLHSFYVPQLSNIFDVKIFLHMEESLRNYLKIQRDVHERGKKEEDVILSIQKRSQDAQTYIMPQKNNADIVFCLKAKDQDKIATCVKKQQFKLEVTLKDNLLAEDMRRHFVGLLGLHVDSYCDLNSKEETLEIEGDVSADDIRLVAQKLDSSMHELLALRPKWSKGMLGIMQLVTMYQLQNKLTLRTEGAYEAFM